TRLSRRRPCPPSRSCSSRSATHCARTAPADRTHCNHQRPAPSGRGVLLGGGGRGSVVRRHFPQHPLVIVTAVAGVSRRALSAYVRLRGRPLHPGESRPTCAGNPLHVLAVRLLLTHRSSAAKC